MGLWSYEGKRVVIAGCFSGMGEAAAQELVRLGAEVHGVDVRESKVPMASFRTVDLKDRASIDAAVAGIGGEIDSLFNCASDDDSEAAALVRHPSRSSYCGCFRDISLRRVITTGRLNVLWRDDRLTVILPTVGIDCPPLEGAPLFRAAIAFGAEA